MVQAYEEQRPRPLRPALSGPRVPPHNLEAEESLIGAMLLSSDAASAAMEICSPGDFYKPAHGHIFAAIHALFERGEPVDAVTVADELTRSGLLDAVGDPVVLVSLQSNTPSIANAEHYAHIVEEHALLRRLVGAAGEIADIGYSVPEDVPGAIDEAERRIFDINQRRTMESIRPLGDLLGESLDHIERLAGLNDTVTGLRTGYLDLDEMLAGLQPSSLTVVGARPSMGKTSFALGMVAHAGVVVRRPVLLFSLEMGHLELSQRLLASEARVDAHRLRIGKLQHEKEWANVSTAFSRLSDAPIFIDDNPNVTVMDIRARARRLKKTQGDLSLVVVDYLQLMTGRGRSENRQVEVAEISRGLKILARELEVPVVALSQLSRGLEQRQDKRPMLSDLRESGCLTADTRITRSDTGASVTMGELFERGERDIPVWALNAEGSLVRASMSHVFASGVKPVYELRLASGRRVRASANHPFRTFDGWHPLADLAPGDRLAVPARFPAPANPVALDCGQVESLAARAVADEHVPEVVFSLPDDQVVSFLRSLWAIGGTVMEAGRPGSPWPGQTDDVPRAYLSAPSRLLAEDVQTLLLRLGVESRIRRAVPGSHSPGHQVWIQGPSDAGEFMRRVIPLTAEGRLRRAVSLLTHRHAGGRVGSAEPGRSGAPVATVTLAPPTAAGVGMETVGTAVGARCGGPEGSDVSWDEIVAIEPVGEAPVFDATVAVHHNFVANGIVAHNSIEQDADVVLFIYREEAYDPETPPERRGVAEIIVSKHRNGRTGSVHLAFLNQYARFDNIKAV